MREELKLVIDKFRTFTDTGKTSIDLNSVYKNGNYSFMKSTSMHVLLNSNLKQTDESQLRGSINNFINGIVADNPSTDKYIVIYSTMIRLGLSSSWGGSIDQNWIYMMESDRKHIIENGDNEVKEFFKDKEPEKVRDEYKTVIRAIGSKMTNDMKTHIYRMYQVGNFTNSQIEGIISALISKIKYDPNICLAELLYLLSGDEIKKIVEHIYSQRCTDFKEFKEYIKLFDICKSVIFMVNATQKEKVQFLQRLIDANLYYFINVDYSQYRHLFMNVDISDMIMIPINEGRKPIPISGGTNGYKIEDLAGMIQNLMSTASEVTTKFPFTADMDESEKKNIIMKQFPIIVDKFTKGETHELINRSEIENIKKSYKEQINEVYKEIYDFTNNVVPRIIKTNKLLEMSNAIKNTNSMIDSENEKAKLDEIKFAINDLLMSIINEMEKIRTNIETSGDIIYHYDRILDHSRKSGGKQKNDVFTII